MWAAVVLKLEQLRTTYRLPGKVISTCEATTTPAPVPAQETPTWQQKTDSLGLGLNRMPAACSRSSTSSGVRRTRPFRKKHRCWTFHVAGIKEGDNGPMLNTTEILPSFRKRYTAVKSLVLSRTTGLSGEMDDASTAIGDARVVVQFTGPQPSEGPGILLCNLLSGTSVEAKPVELGRGRKKKRPWSGCSSPEAIHSDGEKGSAKKAPRSKDSSKSIPKGVPDHTEKEPDNKKENSSCGAQPGVENLETVIQPRKVSPLTEEATPRKIPLTPSAKLPPLALAGLFKQSSANTDVSLSDKPIETGPLDSQMPEDSSNSGMQWDDVVRRVDPPFPSVGLLERLHSLDIGAAAVLSRSNSLQHDHAQDHEGCEAGNSSQWNDVVGQVDPPAPMLGLEERLYSMDIGAAAAFSNDSSDHNDGVEGREGAHKKVSSSQWEDVARRVDPPSPSMALLERLDSLDIGANVVLFSDSSSHCDDVDDCGGDGETGNYSQWDDVPRVKSPASSLGLLEPQDSLDIGASTVPLGESNIHHNCAGNREADGRADKVKFIDPHSEAPALLLPGISREESWYATNGIDDDGLLDPLHYPKWMMQSALRGDSFNSREASAIIRDWSSDSTHRTSDGANSDDDDMVSILSNGEIFEYAADEVFQIPRPAARPAGAGSKDTLELEAPTCNTNLVGNGGKVKKDVTIELVQQPQECDFDGFPVRKSNAIGQPLSPTAVDNFSPDGRGVFAFEGLESVGQNLQNLTSTATFWVHDSNKVERKSSPIQVGPDGGTHAVVAYPSMQELWPMIYPAINIRTVEVDMVVEVRSRDKVHFVGPQTKVIYQRAPAPPTKGT